MSSTGVTTEVAQSILYICRVFEGTQPFTIDELRAAISQVSGSIDCYDSLAREPVVQAAVNTLDDFRCGTRPVTWAGATQAAVNLVRHYRLNA